MIKIKGTNDYIDVYDGDKVARIDGELVLGGFVAESNSIRYWKVPSGVPISQAEKQDLINKVIEKTKGSHMVITFE